MSRSNPTATQPTLFLSWTSLLSLCLWLGSGSTAGAQVLFHSPLPNPSILQSQGMQLASDAIRLAQFGQMDEALARLVLATQLVPASAELHLLLGGLYLELEDFPQAVDALQKARELDPDNAEVLISLGSAYMRRGSYFAAVDALERGTNLQPDNPNGHFQLGNAYLLRGDTNKARDQFKEAIQLEPTFWPAVNNIGLIEYEEGNLEAAIALWEKTIELNDTLAEPKLALATALYIQGNKPAAEALGAEAVQLDPSYSRLETLRINLWGKKLMQDVQVLLQTDTVKEALRQAVIESTQGSQDEGTLTPN